MVVESISVRVDQHSIRTKRLVECSRVIDSLTRRRSVEPVRGPALAKTGTSRKSHVVTQGRTIHCTAMSNKRLALEELKAKRERQPPPPPPPPPSLEALAAVLSLRSASLKVHMEEVVASGFPGAYEYLRTCFWYGSSDVGGVSKWLELSDPHEAAYEAFKALLPAVPELAPVAKRARSV